MRLLTVTNYFEAHRGGVEIVAGMLARGLATRGFEVTWLAADADAEPALAGVDARPLRMWNVTERRLGFPFPLPSPGAGIRLARAVSGADVVVLHDSLCLPSVLAFLIGKLLDRPILLVQHIGDVPYRNPAVRALLALGNRLVARTLLRFADQVVFISRTTEHFFRETRLSRPALLIHNGVDTDIFHPAARLEDRRRLREMLKLRDNDSVALFVGRFVEKKGLGLVRRAAAARPEVVWLLAGWGPIDPAAWGLANVRVMSGRSGADLAELYQASDLLVLPSRGEGFPLVIQEALACGLPVICGAESLEADPAATPWLTGVDVTGSETEAALLLTAAVDQVLDADREDSTQRVAFVREHYAWPGVAERYATVIESMVRVRARPRRLTGSGDEVSADGR